MYLLQEHIEAYVFRKYGYLESQMGHWCSRPLDRRERFTTGSQFTADAYHS
jgi:hypothetical protein